MIQILNSDLPIDVVRELKRLGPHHSLARPSPNAIANVYWDPGTGEQWRTVGCSDRAYPALAAWFENDDRKVEEWARQEREAERTADLREIEDAGREESQKLFEAHVAYWVERGVSRAEAVNLANTWATPEYAYRAVVAARVDDGLDEVFGAPARRRHFADAAFGLASAVVDPIRETLLLRRGFAD